MLIVSRDLDAVGTGRQIELVVAALVQGGRDVHVALLTNSGATRRDSATLACRVVEAGGQVHRIGTRPVVDAAAVARLVRLAVRLRPSVVVPFGRRMAAASVALRGALGSCRLIARVATPVRDRTTRLALRACDLVVASSPGIAASCGTTAVEIIPPCITPDPGGGMDRAEVARRLGLDPARTWTLCVAPLEPEVRIERLLWAIDQLGVVHRGLEHLLVGSGPLLRRVRRRAHVQQLADRLVVMPRCELLPELLGHLRLVWQSGEVACGGAVLDGMARGVPAVMVESDAARQLVVDGETGRIVPALPESELPRRTLALVEDEALAARLGANAAARAAAEFSVAAAVARWNELLDRMDRLP